MADESREDQSREDLTEEASPHRIEEFRQRGIVAQSRELSGLIAFMAAGIALYTMSPNMGTQLVSFMDEILRIDLSRLAVAPDFQATGILKEVFVKAGKIAVSMGFPVCVAGFIFGIVACVVQTGAVFSFEPITPDFGKLNALEGIKRLFSLRQLLETFRIILKSGFILLAAILFIKTEILTSIGHFDREPIYLMSAFGESSRALFFAICGILTVFAIADYGFQRYEHSKSLRMTKQEAKQDMKEREGDPHIRARIRSVQREMARRRMMQAVKKADVVVTNPTHIAVALSYDKAMMSAPKVVAKGADLVAQKIKEIAKEAAVPMVENVPLARTLYKTVKVGHTVPRALYQAVAEVLAYVYRLRKRNL